MAWIFDTSKTVLINSNQIQAIACKFFPDFEIALVMGCGAGTGESGGTGNHLVYTVFRKKVPVTQNPLHRKKVQNRIDELRIQVRQLSDLLATRGESYRDKPRQKIAQKLNHLKGELAMLEGPWKTDEEALVRERKADPEIREVFQRFLERIAEPGFHVSNEIIDFAEIL